MNKDTKGLFPRRDLPRDRKEYLENTVLDGLQILAFILAVTWFISALLHAWEKLGG